MFKAAFPWAKHSEEKAEKEYLKTLPSASREEVAGNIWVAEPTGMDHSLGSRCPCTDISSLGISRGVRNSAMDRCTIGCSAS